jgi:hypothetical protein
MRLDQEQDNSAHTFTSHFGCKGLLYPPEDEPQMRCLNSLEKIYEFNVNWGHEQNSIRDNAVRTGVENTIETDSDDDETEGEVQAYLHPHLHHPYLLLLAALWRQFLLCRHTLFLEKPRFLLTVLAWWFT